jgi:hypothetical protein
MFVYFIVRISIETKRMYLVATSYYRGAAGVSADITIPVFDGVGTVTLANADEKPALHDITLAVLRKSAGYTDESMPANLLTHPWTRFQSAISGARHARGEGLSTTHELPPSHLDLTGTYGDDDYGTLMPCDASSQSDECQPVLDDFRLADEPSTGDLNILFGSWPYAWTSHVRFNPTNTTGRYIIDCGTLYSSGYGRNATPFVHWIARVTADFLVEDGIVRGFGFSGIGEREEENLMCNSASVCDLSVLGCVEFVRSTNHSKVEITKAVETLP